MIVLARIAALAALTSAALIGVAQAQQRTFVCDDGKAITVTVNRNAITAGPIDGQVFQMQPVPGRQWTFYKDDYELVVAPDQRSIAVSIPDYGDVQCAYRGGQAAAPRPSAPPPDFGSQGGGRPSGGPGFGGPGFGSQSGPSGGDEGQVDVDFPIRAKSWGGSVRSGPGIGYRKVGSLAEGEPIVILEEADAPFYQDRPWFRISYRGRTGFQWGGIICPLGSEVPGTYQVC